MELSLRRMLLLVGAALVLLFMWVFSTRLFEMNNAGHMQVRQAWPSGTLSVRTEPGLYWQGCGDITTYPYASTLNFTNGRQGQGGAKDTASEGGETDKQISDESNQYFDSPFSATFQGNSTASVSGIVMFRFPKDQDKLIQIHTTYHSAESAVDTLIRQTVGEAIKLAGPMFTAEEARVTKREEYTSLVLEMIQNGIYKTESNIQQIKGEDGTARNVTVTRIVHDDNGKPIVVKASPLKDFGISIVQFSLRGLDFDKVTQDLMMAKKTAEQEKIVASTNAEKAKQDTITAQEQGKALVAKAQAEELVAKVRKTTQAQAEFEVAQYAAKQAAERAKAKMVEGEAEAHIAGLKVKAGLSPLERANINKDTAIGIAQALSNIQFPSSMILAGGGNGGKMNPLDAIGFRSLYDTAMKMNNDHPAKARNPKVAGKPGDKTSDDDSE
jgi:regulator of protease activity HflC (stomatin/prohibitin superfamily)